MRWEQELPYQKDAYIGYCPFCDDHDRLIFLLKDSRGLYEHCMICNKDWDLKEQ